MANYTSPTDNKSISFPGKFSLKKGDTATIDRQILSESPMEVKVFGTYDTSKAPNGGGGDALHSFQSRKSDDFGGRMNDAIILASLEIYEKGINPYVKSLKVEFSPNKTSGPKVIWEAIITESPDGKAYVGFSSRGGAGNIKSGSAVSRAEQQANSKKKDLPKETGEPNMEFLDVLDYRNPSAAIRQIFWQYTKPKSYPAKPKSNGQTKPAVTDENTKEVKQEPEKEVVKIPTLPIPKSYIKLQGDYNFDVKKQDTFIITSGNNGNLVALPDGSLVDIGELTIISKEDPNDPEIIRLLTPYSDEILDLDSEYTDENFAGQEEDLVFVDSNGEIDTDVINDIKGYDPENPDDTLSTDYSSKYPISKDKEKNIKELIKVAKASGITNGYTIAAILAICKKECGLVPKCEASYSGTTATKIKSIFSRFRKYTDGEVNSIKKDAKKFFDIIYSGTATEKKNGNGPNEGYLFRGRGFNQLTFRGNYELLKNKTGYDIISDPDSVNKIEVASKVVVEYMKYKFEKDAGSFVKKKYNFTDINSFKTLDDAVGAVYHANAGFGKSYSEIVADSTGGRAKAFKYVGQLYDDYLGPNRKTKK